MCWVPHGELALAALHVCADLICGLTVGKYLGEHPMSYSTKSVTLGVFLWLRQAGNNELLCNEVSTIRCASAKSAACCTQVIS